LPEGLTLDFENYDQILEAFLPKFGMLVGSTKQKPFKSVDEAPVGLVLLYALADAFPCRAEMKQ
jgi:hypothetical protein